MGRSMPVELLERRIIEDGEVYPGNILKVDSFLNHQIDVGFLCELGREFHRLFENCGVNKILTIEASGIGIACITAQFFGVPVVFAKKSKTKNIAGDVYTTTVDSYTHGAVYDVFVSKRFLGADDRVLIIDDFLARGAALLGLMELVTASGAALAGAGIVIEKAFQQGGGIVRSKGVRVESLAKIKSLSDDGVIEFTD